MKVLFALTKQNDRIDRIKMETLYRNTLKNMEETLVTLRNIIPLPKRVAILDGVAFRYEEKSIRQAIVQKLARIISGLYTAKILMMHGFVQEQASLQRTLDEFGEDVTFLSLAAINDDRGDLPQRFLAAFFEEEFDDPAKPLTSTQRRPMIPRKKIQAYIANAQEAGLDPCTGVAVSRTVSKVYSGYVHGVSTQIMELYRETSPRFNVTGQIDTSLFIDHRDDTWNYFFRGICIFGLAAKAFRKEHLAASILQFRDIFERESDRWHNLPRAD